MFEMLKKLIKPLDDAAKRIETKCSHCGHINKGHPNFCEECGNDLEERMD